MKKKRSEENSGDLNGAGFPLAQLLILICISVGSLLYFLWKWYKKSH